MNYIKISFAVDPVQPTADILTAFLNEIGFESYEIDQSSLNAFIPDDNFNEKRLVDMLKSSGLNYIYDKEEIIHENWNAKWESKYEPVVIDEICTIRAPFHDFEVKTKYDIVIQPKMSFGTGHHPTTELMIREIANLQIEELDVLDMGSGTGVLAVLADQMRARSVFAVEIDAHAAENCLENVQTNNCIHVDVENGDIRAIFGRKFDVIFANINLNALLNDLNEYVVALKPGGNILFSGFYQQDKGQLIEPLSRLGLVHSGAKYIDNWTVLRFQKNHTGKD